MLFEQQLIEDENPACRACADLAPPLLSQSHRYRGGDPPSSGKGRDLLKSLTAGCGRSALAALKSPPAAPNETLAERHQQIIARIDFVISSSGAKSGRARSKAVLEIPALTGRSLIAATQASRWRK